MGRIGYTIYIFHTAEVIIQNTISILIRQTSKVSYFQSLQNFKFQNILLVL